MTGPAHLTPQDVLAVVEARRTKNAAVAEWQGKEDQEKGEEAIGLDILFWAEAARVDKRFGCVYEALGGLSTEALKELQTLMYAGREGGWRAWPEDEWDKQPWKRWPQAVEFFKSTNGMDRERMIHSIGEKAPLEHYLYLAIEGLGLDLGWTTLLQWLRKPEPRFDTTEEEDEEY